MGDAPVSTMVGSEPGLTAFIPAFTFGIVFDRFEARKELVREEANAIGTACLRSDFLPEPDRTESRRLFREYLDMRLEFTRMATTWDRTREELALATLANQRVHDRLWEMAVAGARGEMNPEVAALYIESLNSVFDIHALRVAIGIQSRIPSVIWLMLLGVTVLGMFGIGYRSGIASGSGFLVQPILAVSFAMVITLIASLDRTNSGLIAVSQQSLIDMPDSLEAAAESVSAKLRELPLDAGTGF